MDIERIEPSKFTQETIRELVEQNGRILEMNASLLRSLSTPPQMVVGESSINRMVPTI